LRLTCCLHPLFGGLRIKIIPGSIREVPALKPGLARNSDHCNEKEDLGGATLTVAVLVVFLILTLSALLLLVELTGLATLLTGLAALLTRLTLTRLVALLILFIHIVCHEISS
jgi:hypothetical protein